MSNVRAVGQAHSITWVGDDLVVKRYGSSEGPKKARREWTALVLAHRHATDLVPEPVAEDMDGDPPSITMRRVPGRPLGAEPLTDAQVQAVAEAMNALHRCVPADELDGLQPSGIDPKSTLGGLRSRLAAAPRPTGDAVVTAAYDSALEWLAGPEARQLVEDEPPAVLGRGDNNLPNFMWDGQRLRLLDFEYSGRGDRCVEIADLIEHIGSRITPDATWSSLIDRLSLTHNENRRLLAGRRFCAASWLQLLQPGQAADRRNPAGTLHAQSERILALLER